MEVDAEESANAQAYKEMLAGTARQLYQDSDESQSQHQQVLSPPPTPFPTPVTPTWSTPSQYPPHLLHP